jgi:hypothetical protein
MQVFVVDDDGGEGREFPVVSTLTALGYTHFVYDVAWGALTADDLFDAGDAVIWLTGATSLSLDSGERALISGYLGAGGRLLLSGQEIASDLAAAGSPYYTVETLLWFINTLHCMQVSSMGSHALAGVAGDPLGDGLLFSIEDDGPFGQGSPDVVRQLSAVNFLHYEGLPNDWFGGVHFTDANHYLVYLSFGLEGIIEDSQRELLVSRALEWFGVTTGIQAAPAPPASLSLAPIAPNPVVPPATISYRLAAPGVVRLRIYDVGGRLVRTLVDGRESAAEHQHVWNGRDATGRPVPSGVYFSRLEVGGQSATERLVLVR